jgi:O-antigen ligase
MQEAIPYKWWQGISLAILFASIAAFAYTGSYLLLVVPVGYLFMLLMGLNWKTAYWILLFTIPFSTQLEFFNDTLSTTVPDEPMMWLFLLTFGVTFVRNPDIFPKHWWRNPLVMVVLLQYLWLIVAVCYSKETFISVKFLLAKTWFLISFFVIPFFVFKEKKDFKRGFFLMLIPMVITMLIVLYRHKAYNFHFRKVENAVSGLYYNHVDYSTVISMFFPLLLIAFPMLKRKTGLKVLLAFTILFFLVATYLTYARAAMVAIFFSIAVGLAMRLRLANFIMPLFYGMMAVMLVFMIHHNKYIDYRPNFNKTYMHKKFADHIVATFRGEDMSSMERLYRWIAGIRMSTDRPVTGYGPNTFYYYYKPYAVTSFRTWVSRNKEHSTTHNYFLYMLVEQGWPAMILYAILVAMVFAQAQKIYFRFKDKFYRNVTLGLAMMFAAGFINNFFSELLETHKVGCLFFVSVALLVVLDHKSREEQKRLAEGNTQPIS